MQYNTIQNKITNINNSSINNNERNDNNNKTGTNLIILELGIELGLITLDLGSE